MGVWTKWKAARDRQKATRLEREKKIKKDRDVKDKNKGSKPVGIKDLLIIYIRRQREGAKGEENG